ncbi:MAG TPA: hypothetical protein VNW97_01150 [Candidatus Saccharimonadales bacterium]|jgi:hypothetical protein|nr:hypothetical protein [Candidatus Saccharimonadales bacterium]
MENLEYKKALEAAHAEMQDILTKRAAFDLRLAQLKSTIDSLSILLKETPQIDHKALMDAMNEGSDVIGISDAIRHILSAKKVPLSPVELREKLGVFGIDVNRYANVMAVIHNTLARLEKQGEVTKIGDSYTLVTRESAFRRGLEAALSGKRPDK